MATFTSRIRLEKQANGENSGTWGTVLNQNVIDLVDEAIAGYTIVSCSSTAVELSTTNNGSSDQARSAALELQGTLTSSVDITIPSVSKIYFVKNNTSGSHAITLKLQQQLQRLQSLKVVLVLLFVMVQMYFQQDKLGLGLGTAATLNFGTSINELIPVSSADIRYVPTSTSSTISSNKVFSGTVITSGTNTFTSTTTQSGKAVFTAEASPASSATFSGAVGTPEVSIASATSLNVDFSTGNNFCHYIRNKCYTCWSS